MSSHLSGEMTVAALRQAIGRRRPSAGVMHHSDRGSQYAAGAYQQLLGEQGMICSMSRRGDCYDNAVIESFFATLKVELISRERFQTREEA